MTQGQYRHTYNYNRIHECERKINGKLNCVFLYFSLWIIRSLLIFPRHIVGHWKSASWVETIHYIECFGNFSAIHVQALILSYRSLFKLDLISSIEVVVRDTSSPHLIGFSMCHAFYWQATRVKINWIPEQNIKHTFTSFTRHREEPNFFFIQLQMSVLCVRVCMCAFILF